MPQGRDAIDLELVFIFSFPFLKTFNHWTVIGKHFHFFY